MNVGGGVALKRLDIFVLRLLHRLADATYRKFGIDNYGIGVGLFFVSFAASFVIFFTAIQMAKTDPTPQVAQARTITAFFGLFFFGMLSAAAFLVRRQLRHFLQMAYDTETVTSVQPLFARTLRWIFVLMYVVNLVLASFGQSTWWSMSDAFLLGVGLMFLSAEPPSMDERMRKTFQEEM